jgi:hypothetical protein
MEAQVCTWVNPCEICGEQKGTGGRFFIEFFGSPLTVSFHHDSPPSYIRGMNKDLLVATVQRHSLAPLK